MFKRIRLKIGIKLLITFSTILILSMVSLIYLSTQLVAEFGEFSASKNEANITDNTYALLARITHEQAMRYDSIFQKIAASSSLIAKRASAIQAHRDSYSEEPFTTSEKLVISPKNGIFSNGPSEKTMVLYWGSSTISPAISRQIKALSKLDILLENSKESIPESVACYFTSDSAIARYYPNIHGVDEIPTGFDIRKAHWYVKSRPENNPERKTVWSNVYLDIVGQGLMTTASSPVYSETGQYLGAAGIDVTLDSIVKDILSDIGSCHKIENMFSFLVDRTGKIIAFPPEYLEMFDLKIDTDKMVDSSVILEKSLLESSNAEVRKIGKKMIEEPYQVSQFSLNGRPYIFSSHFMPSTGWRLGVVVPESVVYASVQETRDALDSTVETMTTRFTIVALSFLLGTIIIMIVFSIKNIINPLNTLSKAALRVREGDLTTHVDLHRQDEIGILAYSFNDMIKALRKGKELEEEYTRKLEQKVDERTLELKNKNDELKNTLRLLKQEIDERKQAEEQIEASLKEKEVLLKEIHHRVKNNLQVISSMLNLQSQHITDKASLAMFQESQNRIRAMALIHEKLYTSEDLSHIDIASYIHSLTHQLITTYSTASSRVSMDIAITDIFLTITTAIPCGLIINELVSNALKHAFPQQREGTITVSITPSNKDSLILTVSDTGIGFPEGIDFRNTDTLGMQLVNSLVEQLEGTITLDRSKGTRVRIEFRKQE